MNQDPKTKKNHKNEMKDKWNKEIIDADRLLLTSQDFFINNLQNYSINCLFIELLDFQIYLKDQGNHPEFFKLENDNKSDMKDFLLPLLPIHNNDYIFRNGFITATSFLMDIITISQKRLQNKFVEFLDKNPSFKYYFWNITFPHMYSEFLCEENCERAKIFLDGIKDNEEAFLQGASSFIRHNYSFQDSFMKLFFVYYKKYDNIIDCTRMALLRSIQKLTIPQLKILKNLETKEGKEMIINEIIIRCIKLWKYSALYSPTKSSFNIESDLIDNFKKHFFEDQNHEQNINIFLNPIFEQASLEMTSNSISIKRFIGKKSYNHAITFLDLLIVEQIINDPIRSEIFQKYWDNFNDKYFLRKAFTYALTEDSMICKNPVPQRFVPDVDPKIKNEWKKYEQECIAQNKYPLEPVYKPDKFGNVNDSELFKVGIELVFYETEYSEKIKQYLEKEDVMLIPLKENIESMSNFQQLYANYFASEFSIKHDNFVQGVRNLYADFLKNNIISLFKSSQKSGRNYNKIKFHELIIKLQDILDRRLAKKFNSIFNDNDIFNKTIKEFDNIVNEFRNEAPDIISNILLTESDKLFFKIALDFLVTLTRSQLTAAYDNYTLKIKIPKETFQLNPFDNNPKFQVLSFSGIYDYINNTMISMQKDLKLGQFFSFISEINCLLAQFLSEQNSSFLCEKILDGKGDENLLIQTIFAYSLKYTEPKDENPQKLADLLTALLCYSYHEIKKLKADVPNLSSLFKQIESLTNLLNITITNNDDDDDEKIENTKKEEK